jgi:hypothetical protein
MKKNSTVPVKVADKRAARAARAKSRKLTLDEKVAKCYPAKRGTVPEGVESA